MESMDKLKERRLLGLIFVYSLIIIILLGIIIGAWYRYGYSNTSATNELEEEQVTELSGIDEEFIQSSNQSGNNYSSNLLPFNDSQEGTFVMLVGKTISDGPGVGVLGGIFVILVIVAVWLSWKGYEK